jgi:hypothetical protein
MLPVACCAVAGWKSDRMSMTPIKPIFTTAPKSIFVKIAAWLARSRHNAENPQSGWALGVVGKLGRYTNEDRILSVSVGGPLLTSVRKSESQLAQKRHTSMKARCKSLYVAAGPVSRILSADRNRQDGHSSRPRIAARLKRPTRRFDAPSRHVPRANPKTSSLFGLAPCGVYPACRIAATAVRSYRTFSPLPQPASDLVALR